MLTARHRVDDRIKAKPTYLRLKQPILLWKSRFWVFSTRPVHERLRWILKTHSAYTCNCLYVHA